MEFNEIIDSVCNKFEYDEELKKAISITLPLMIEQYGEKRKQEVIDTFMNTPIYSSGKMDKETRDSIENKEMQGLNNHVDLTNEIDPYDSSADPGSYYSMAPVYDENMEVIDEKRWVVIKNMKDEYSGKKYKELFGTYINMPYFIHEMGHAFGMHKSKYEKEGNICNSKKGMYEKTEKYIQNGDKYEVEDIDTQGVIIEEMINEKDTQEMLFKLLGVTEDKELHDKLDSINHVNSNYSAILVQLAGKFERVLGKEQLLNLRVDNDISVLEKFKEGTKKSGIYTKYLDGKEPYEEFKNKTFDLFKLKAKAFSMPLEEYNIKTKELMTDAFAVLCGYQEGSGDPEMTEEKFTNIRNDILGIKKEKPTFIESLKLNVEDEKDIKYDENIDSKYKTVEKEI